MRDYNPLSLDELGRNAVRALMDYPTDALPPSEAFTGAGVYTLHYEGSYRPYAEMSGEPIYVARLILLVAARGDGRRRKRLQCSTSGWLTTHGRSRLRKTCASPTSLVVGWFLIQCGLD